jgi:hypothetical protein
MKFSNKSKKIAMVGMVAIVFTLGGMILTGSMLDNSDPITSGQYMVSNDPIPIPEVMVVEETKASPHDPMIEGLKELTNEAIDKVGELLNETKEEPESTPDSKGTAEKVGGIGLGTVFTLYVAYKFIFR